MRLFLRNAVLFLLSTSAFAAELRGGSSTSNQQRLLGEEGCQNTAAYGGQDTNCPAEKPICVDALGREPPFYVGGASCAACVNTMQGASKLLPDQGCSLEEPFCVNQDNSEPDPNTAGQGACVASHPSEVTGPPTVSPSGSPSAVPTRSPSEVPTSGATTQGPSADPSSVPSPSPSGEPSVSPSGSPTVFPTSGATTQGPSADPSSVPSSSPTATVGSLPCDLGLTFNPSGQEYPQMLENGDNLCTLRMTPDAGASMAASAFKTHEFKSTNTGRAFEMSFGYRIYGEAAGSADGIAFVMHQDARGAQALGGGGGDMGVYSTQSGISIKPALVIELDTYPNPGGLKDNGQNNIHIMTVSADGTLTEIGESNGIDIRTDNSGSPEGKLWVDYGDDQVIRVYINNKGTTKPVNAVISQSVDLDTLFSGQSVTFGYTAAVGGQGDYHDITSWSFDEPIVFSSAAPSTAPSTGCR